MLGHQTRDAALACLQNCPLLEDLERWSHWSLVFEPQHGNLKDFLQKYGGVHTIHADGETASQLSCWNKGLSGSGHPEPHNNNKRRKNELKLKLENFILQGL